MDVDFSPKQTANELAIAERTLRFWSDRFGKHLSSGARSAKSDRGWTHRRYSAGDLAQLRLVRRLAEQRLALNEIDAILAGTRPAPPPPLIVPERHNPPPTRATTQQLVQPFGEVLQQNQRLLAQIQESLLKANEALQERIRQLEDRLSRLEDDGKVVAAVGDRVMSEDAADEAAIAPETTRPAPTTLAAVAPVEAPPRPSFLDRMRARFGPGRSFPEGLPRGIARAMHRKGWTKGELAYFSKVPVETLDRILRGERPDPGPDVLAALEAALDVSLEDGPGNSAG